MEQQEVKKTFEEFGNYVIEKAKSNLKTGGKYGSRNASGKLYDSLEFEFKQNPNSIEFDFYAEDYWKFVDQGVKGKKSSALAPNSDYKFGTGTGKKGGLRASIDKWVIRKGLTNTRNEKGQFINRKQMVSMISSAIYNRGLETTKFFSKPFDEAFKKLPDEILESYGQDLNKFLIKELE
jgi:hypothetical protein